jgi:uncharacterized protein YdcH (DUF465 family)
MDLIQLILDNTETSLMGVILLLTIDQKYKLAAKVFLRKKWLEQNSLYKMRDEEIRNIKNDMIDVKNTVKEFVESALSWRNKSDNAFNKVFDTFDKIFDRLDKIENHIESTSKPKRKRVKKE